MNRTDFLSGPVADALGWTLLHTLWQGFALVLPTAVVLHLLRGRSSHLRYQVSALALLIQLMASAATFAWYYQPAAGILTATAHASRAQTLPVRWQTLTQTLPWHEQVQHFLESHLGQFVLIYLIGVVVFGLRLAGGWLFLQRLSRTATQPVSPKWSELTDALRSALTVRAVVQVRESARIMVPMVVGVLKPVLLLPVGLSINLSIREVEAVLAHELAHIKRHDYAVNLLQSVMEVLFFFHPALWWLSARVREEREHCCDDLAVQAIGGDGRTLAQALARVEELRLTQVAPTASADRPALAMAFATERRHLLHRVRRMLGVPTGPFVSNGSLVGLTLATTLFVSVSVYAMQQEKPQPKPKPRPTQPQSTRRHKVDGNSEYGMVGDRKVSYVIWKGQKLPAARVARLQRQLDQVTAGQLNLNDVKQPDRDMLLTMVETNNSFDEGMDGLAVGLAQLDYNNIIKTGMDAANAAGTFPVNVDSVLREVKKIDYNSLIGDAMASLSNLERLSDSLNRQRAVLNRQMDSLPELMAHSDQLQTKLSKLWAENAALHARMSQRQQLFETSLARMSSPYKQRQLMMEERTELQKQASFMRKQVNKPEFLPVKNVLLDELSTVETKLSELDHRIDNITQKEIRPFHDNKKYSQYFERMRFMMDSIRTNEEEIIDVDQRLRGKNSDTDQSDYIPEPPRAPINVQPIIPVIPPRPARAPRPAKVPNVVRPAMPPAPPVPVLAPAPAAEPAVAPTPKVAPVPRVPKQ